LRWFFLPLSMSFEAADSPYSFSDRMTPTAAGFTPLGVGFFLFFSFLLIAVFFRVFLFVHGVVAWMTSILAREIPSCGEFSFRLLARVRLQVSFEIRERSLMVTPQFYTPLQPPCPLLDAHVPVQ